MARIIPSLDDLGVLQHPLNDGEWRVLNVLGQLGDDWIVFVQPRVGLDQPDFVVAHYDYGVVAVEVKGWRPGGYRQRRDCVIEANRSGEWIPTTEAPLTQAARYRDALFSRFFADASTTSSDFGSVRGIVVFTGHSTAEAREMLKNTRNAAERYIGVWGLAELQRNLATGLGGTKPRSIPARNIDRIRRELAEPEFISDQRRPLKLSVAARNVATNPSNARIRRVRGTAGCGKSLGLAARAAQLSKEGKDVLVLTFNSTLPHYLHDLAARRCAEITADVNRITFTHFHAFCNRICDNSRLAGHEPGSGRLPGISHAEDEIVGRAIDAYRAGFGLQYDAVLVDEGQDFNVGWWNFLRTQVVRPDGEMLLVADPTQDVYEQRAWTDEDVMKGAGFRGPWTDLTGSYRMPADLIPVVAEFAERYVFGERIDPVVPDDPDEVAEFHAPTLRRWINSPTGSPIGAALGHEVVRLLAEHADLHPWDVVFLAPSHQVGLQAVEVVQAAGHEVQHMFAVERAEQRTLKDRFWGQAPGVKGCTVQSFKGWEARAVVLGITKQRESRRLAYVGMTRVKGDPQQRRAFLSVVNFDRSLDAFQSRFMSGAVEAGVLSGRR
jgi:hypothetical protein